jgi:autotransporter adhesin
MQRQVCKGNSECTQPVAHRRKSLLACALLAVLSSSSAMAELITDGGLNDPAVGELLITSGANEVALDANQSAVRVGSNSGTTVIGATESSFSGSLIVSGNTTVTSLSADEISVGGSQVVTSNQLSAMQNSNANQLSAMQNSNATFADHVDSRFNAVDRRIDQVEERAYAGVASVAALAAIPAPAHGKRFSVGAGLGNYSNESAVAVGFRAAITESTSVSAGVSRNTASKTAANLGVGYSW